ncbi:MAG: LysR family transcriptional regulator [Maritimibacter sp.]|nr:LysR family transcriptional regulator [Maritimibacter sp.]
MHSRLLTYFLVVYTYKSVSVASEKLRISQPALTKSIQQLEASIGVRLFDREARGVSATPYADILARHVRLMDSEYRHALAEIEVVRGGGGGVVSIGAGPVWYSCLLPPVIAQFTAENPDIRVRVQSGVIDTMVPGLRSGQFDFICTNLDFPPQSDLATESLIELSHVVVAGVEHPLRRLDRVTAHDMKGYDWVALIDDQVGTGRILSYYSAHGEPPPKIAVETSSPTQMMELLSNAPMLGQIPRRMMSLAQRFGLAPLDTQGAFWRTPSGICYRHSEHRLPAVSRFLNALRTSLAAGEGSA